MQQIEAEREARRLLPEFLREWLGQPVNVMPAQGPDDQVDLTVSTPGGQLFFQVKASSSPTIVDAVAESWLHQPTGDVVRVLVVPAMTPAGAKACGKHGVNWIDLSGNADVRTGRLVLHVEGRPNRFGKRGRPASPFAPRSSRIARLLLLDPERWWLQKELSDRTQISPGQVSRVVATLMRTNLIERQDRLVRPTSADNLLDAWADDYKFDRHDVVLCHITGGGMQLAHEVADRLNTASVPHAFTGLAAAWTTSQFAQFRSVAIYVTGDPRQAAEQINARRNERGANVQLIGPDDTGVFDGQSLRGGLQCVAPVQTYLDLLNLPERASEAAEHMRSAGDLWGRP